jgi:hypothetical protein
MTLLTLNTLNTLKYLNMIIQTITTTEPKTYNMMGLSKSEIELLQEGLIVLKSNRMIDAEEFRAERKSCVEMYHAIDAELNRKEENHDQAL